MCIRDRVGTVAFDAIETPFGKTNKIIGGAATYIGLSASKFYNHINLVSVVGDDFPKSAIEMMQNHKINTEGLQIKEGEKTFFWAGKYHNNMNTRDTLDTQLNVLENFEPWVPANYQDCECLMLGNLMPSVQQKVLLQLKERPKLIVLDTMNFWMDNCLKDLMEALKEVDVLTINDEEARQLSGEHSLVKAARKILSYGPKYLIIKKGEHGSLLYHNDQTFLAPAVILNNVVDPTGAGDTFAGGMAGFLASQDTLNFEVLKTAMVYGSSVASFCVTDFGTKAIVNTSILQIKKRVDALKKSVEFKTF